MYYHESWLWRGQSKTNTKTRDTALSFPNAGEGRAGSVLKPGILIAFPLPVLGRGEGRAGPVRTETRCIDYPSFASAGKEGGGSRTSTETRDAALSFANAG